MKERQDKPRAEYHSDDREILVGLFQVLFWRWMIPLIPRWISPNAITLFGAMCSVGAVVLTMVGLDRGDPTFYLFSGGLLFLYLTADNVDGAHARRTGRASPMGELLDHGFDGIASGALLICGASILHLDPVPMSMLVGVGSVAFTLLMWEQYRTNLLIIPAVSGTEGVALVIGLDVVAYVFDNPPWMRYDGSELFTYSNGVLGFVMTSYVVAAIPSVLRARKVGANALELTPVAVLVAGLALFSVAGADLLYPSIAMALVGSDVGARFIHLRRQERDSGPLKWTRWILLVPVVPALLADDPAAANDWALVTIAMGVVFYVFEMVRAARAIGDEPDATNV